MISKQEILEQAKKYGLLANTIEKDYVLSWLLAGIAISKALCNKWIFKGGTCLKKCYFEEYRFSEDLGFTLIEASHISEDFLKKEFSNISEWIYEESGIEIPSDSLEFASYENPRGKISIQWKVAYKGPMQRRGNNSTIKLDLSCDEVVVEKPIQKFIHHPYSDMDMDGLSIQTYCVEEIFAEKLRVLTERMRPRDLYDVIYLHRDERWQPNSELVLKILKKKCEFKQVLVQTMTSLDSMPNKQDLKADWCDMLDHQIGELESSGYYWRQLPLVFEWLYGS